MPCRTTTLLQAAYAKPSPLIAHLGTKLGIWSMEVPIPRGVMVPRSAPGRPGILVAGRGSALRFSSQRPGAGCIPSLQGFAPDFLGQRHLQVPKGGRDEAPGGGSCCPSAMGESRGGCSSTARSWCISHSFAWLLAGVTTRCPDTLMGHQNSSPSSQPWSHVV